MSVLFYIINKKTPRSLRYLSIIYLLPFYKNKVVNINSINHVYNIFLKYFFLKTFPYTIDVC